MKFHFLYRYLVKIQKTGIRELSSDYSLCLGDVDAQPVGRSQQFSVNLPPFARASPSGCCGTLLPQGLHRSAAQGGLCSRNNRKLQSTNLALAKHTPDAARQRLGSRLRDLQAVESGHGGRASVENTVQRTRHSRAAAAKVRIPKIAETGPSLT